MNKMNQHYFYINSAIKGTISVIVYCMLLFVGACSSGQPLIANDGNTISDVRIKISGAASDSRPDMSDICKGFILSRKQVKDFFINATPVKDTSTENKFNILPCYVSGTATINNNKYSWSIRSGGIGEFFAKNMKIIKVCGKGCCSKVSGIC